MSTDDDDLLRGKDSIYIAAVAALSVALGQLLLLGHTREELRITIDEWPGWDDCSNDELADMVQFCADEIEKQYRRAHTPQG